MFKTFQDKIPKYLNFLEWDISVFAIAIIIKLLCFNAMVTGDGEQFKGIYISTIGAIFILLFWTILFPKKYRLGLLFLVDAATTFIIIADLMFFRYFSDVLSIPVLTQAAVVGSVRSSLGTLWHMTDLLFLADMIIIIPLVIYFYGRNKLESHTTFLQRLISSLLILAIGTSLSYWGVSMLLKSQPGILKSFYDRMYIVENIGLFNYHTIDIYRYIQDKNKLPVTQQEKNAIGEFFLEKKTQQSEKLNLNGVGKDKNLIVIQVEALQQFVIGRKIGNQEITPNLNKLIKRSIYFNNYFCETAGGGTSDAEFLANVSLFPVKDGAVYIRFPGAYYYSMPKIMKEQGYGSSVFHAFKAAFWNRSVMYKSLGFDNYYNKADFTQDEITGMGLSDKSFFRQTIEKQKKQTGPYYDFLITLTSHFPFDNDKKYYSKFDVGEYKDTLFGNYLEGIHYADEALGQYITELEKEGMLDNSVLAIYGDHYAIPRNNKDYLGKFLGIEMNSFNWVNNQKIPLIIHLPNDQAAGNRKIAGGGIDFMPTILNIMGVDTSTAPLMGRDLLNSKEGLVIMRHGFFRDDKYLSLTADGQAFNVKDGSKYPIEKLKNEKDFMEKSLNYSDLMIENNLGEEIRAYLKNKTAK